MTAGVPGRLSAWARRRQGLLALLDAAGRFQIHEGFVLSGYIAFAALLAIFPFAIFCASLAAATTGPEEIEALSRFIVEALPPQVASAIGPPLTSALSLEGRGVLTLSGVGAVWAASNGVEAFRVSFERAYRREAPRPWIVNRLLGMAAVLLGAVGAGADVAWRHDRTRPPTVSTAMGPVQAPWPAARHAARIALATVAAWASSRQTATIAGPEPERQQPGAPASSAASRMAA